MLEAEECGAACGLPGCWLVPRLAEPRDALTCAALGVGDGDERAWF